MSADWQPHPLASVHDLPDEMLIAAASFLKAKDLLSFCATCQRAKNLEVDFLWKGLCATAWENWPRYRLTAEVEAQLDTKHPGTSWLARYRIVQADADRTLLTQEELETLTWHFNFTPGAGGRGRQTLKAVRFTERKIYVPGYPPLDYFLVDPVPAQSVDEAIAEFSASGEADPNSPQRLGHLRQLLSALMANPQHRASLPGQEQCVQIANFPPHRVQRLQNTREWLIYNGNVTIVSCGPDGLGEYDERGFLTDLSMEEREEEPATLS